MSPGLVSYTFLIILSLRIQILNIQLLLEKSKMLIYYDGIVISNFFGSFSRRFYRVSDSRYPKNLYFLFGSIKKYSKVAEMFEFVVKGLNCKIKKTLKQCKNKKSLGYIKSILSSPVQIISNFLFVILHLATK